MRNLIIFDLFTLNHRHQTFSPNGKSDYLCDAKAVWVNEKLFLINFHPKGRVGGIHYLRYDAFGVYVIKGLQSRLRRDGFALKCLAYESLRLVQDSVME